MSAAADRLALARKQVVLNLLPSMELHPERVPGYIRPDLWQRIAATKSGHRHLSSHLLESEGLRGNWVDSFDTLPARLALLSPATLDRLTFLVGVALNAEWIVTRLKRSDVQAVRGTLSAEDYRFASGRARLLGLPVDWPAPPSAEVLGAHLQHSGDRCVGRLFAGSPHALARRYELRRPKDGDLAMPPEHDLSVKTIEALCRKIGREIGEPCSLLFD